MSPPEEDVQGRRRKCVEQIEYHVYITDDKFFLLIFKQLKLNGRQEMGKQI